MVSTKENDLQLLQSEGKKLARSMRSINAKLDVLFDKIETLAVCYGEYGDEALAACAKMLNLYAAILAQFANHEITVQTPREISILLEKFSKTEQAKQ